MPAGVSAYVALANVTLSSAAATITFSSISGAYRDLILIANASITSGSAKSVIRFNSDSGTNYNLVTMEGDGGSTNYFLASLSSIQGGGNNNNLSTALGQFTYNLMDYSATDKHKSVLVRSDNSGLGTIAAAGRWANTAAITTLSVGLSSASTYVTGSTFALYGIAS
jgi:hypothetical protein